MIQAAQKLKLADISQNNLQSILDKLDPFCACLLPSIVALWLNDSNQAYYTYNDNYLLGNLYPVDEAPFWSLTSRTMISEDDLKNAIQFIRENDKSCSEIRFIPSNRLSDGIKNNTLFSIKEEGEEELDYIYDLELTTKRDGETYKDLRNYIKHYQNLYGKDSKIRVLEDWDSIMAYKELAYELFDDWTHYGTDGSNNYQMEERAFGLFFSKELKNLFNNVYLVVLYYQDKLVAYSINEKIDSTTAIAHFQKSNLNLSSISYYMFSACAEILLKRNFRYINFQEDVGITGLRAFKKKMRPVFNTKLSKLYF